MTNNLVERLRGRARFLRDRGEIKSPELIEEAIEALSTTRGCTCHPDDRPAAGCQGKYAASECQRAALSTTPGREEIAWFAAEYFGHRPLSEMAQNRPDLRLKLRDDASFDVNEPTRDDCLLFADAILSLLRKEGVQ